MKQTEEVLPLNSNHKDILTGEVISITPEMTLAPRAILILEPVEN